MQKAKTQVIVGFFLTVAILVTYGIISQGRVDPQLRQARIAYETTKLRMEQERLRRQHDLEAEKIRIQRANLRRYTDLNFYGTVAIFGACGLAIIIVATGYSHAKIRRASVCIARIGQHSEIPVHQKDLQRFYPIAVNLSLAEIEASASTAHEQAYQISRQMLADIGDYTRALYPQSFAGQHRLLSTGHQEIATALPSAMFPVPTFADLLQRGMLAPGKPLLLGYDRQGQPQMRTLQDLKSVAIAGWQGSGKTLSMAYIVVSCVLAHGVKVFIVDPHNHHPESLSAVLKPLECTGNVTFVNPFDTPVLLEDLNCTLDRRLAGQEPSEPGILLVIDELARLAKADVFDGLLKFLERCTEETRKANITFLGGSPKWTARYFKGRADIRGCMNSMLIHKTKPSQAELLLEDARDKNLVKQLQHPGDAILATDYDLPVLVTMPFCSRQDMEMVAQMVGKQTTNFTDYRASSIQHPVSSNQHPVTSIQHPETNTISINQLRAEQLRKLAHDTCNPLQLTVEQIKDLVQHRKQQEPGLTQAKIARQAGMSPSVLSNILNGKRPPKDKEKLNLYEVLVIEKPQEQQMAAG